MAPEQFIGKAGTIGPAADIYALGVLLYEMLTGRPPFRGETASETERQAIHDEPVSPSRLNPKVPRDLETICLKCLHKDPQRRYASASALLEDLQRFQRNEPIAARPPGFAERTAKWVRRHPTHAAILAASLVVAILLVGGGFWLALQQAHQRNGVETDLTELARLQGSARWAEARAALWRAETWFQGGGPDDLRCASRRLVAISTSSSSSTRSASSVQPGANWRTTRPGPIASISRRLKVPDWERVAARLREWLPSSTRRLYAALGGRSL